MATKTTTTKLETDQKAAAPKAPRKPRAAAVKKKDAPVEATAAVADKAEQPAVHHAPAAKKHEQPGKYIFATGRRKTAVANVRLFLGSGETVVNKKPFKQYFAFTSYQEEALMPFQLTGLQNDYYFTCHINGGGTHSQAQALRHGIATALATLSPEVRKVLKKNGMLTRDDRKKERKKPGLKRARRSPQWAKR